MNALLIRDVNWGALQAVDLSANLPAEVSVSRAFRVVANGRRGCSREQAKKGLKHSALLMWTCTVLRPFVAVNSGVPA